MWKYIAEDKTFEQQVVKQSHPLDCWDSVDAQLKMHVLHLDISWRILCMKVGPWV